MAGEPKPKNDDWTNGAIADLDGRTARVQWRATSDQHGVRSIEVREGGRGADHPDRVFSATFARGVGAATISDSPHRFTNHAGKVTTSVKLFDPNNLKPTPTVDDFKRAAHLLNEVQKLPEYLDDIAKQKEVIESKSSIKFNSNAKVVPDAASLPQMIQAPVRAPKL